MPSGAPLSQPELEGMDMRFDFCWGWERTRDGMGRQGGSGRTVIVGSSSIPRNLLCVFSPLLNVPLGEGEVKEMKKPLGW